MSALGSTWSQLELEDAYVFLLLGRTGTELPASDDHGDVVLDSFAARIGVGRDDSPMVVVKRIDDYFATNPVSERLLEAIKRAAENTVGAQRPAAVLERAPTLPIPAGTDVARVSRSRRPDLAQRSRE